MSIIYLIHFDQPIGNPANPRGQAQHYLGCTEDLPDRIKRHRSGNGSRIMSAVSSLGIGWDVVRIWEGDYSLEHRLKNRKNSPKLCPICTGETS